NPPTQPTDWFAIKKCPISGTTSSCGQATQACKSCAGYPMPADAGCYVHATTSINPLTRYLDYWFLSGAEANACVATYQGVICDHDLPNTDQCRGICDCPAPGISPRFNCNTGI